MALNDNAVLTAAVGYIFVGDFGTAAPTPAEIEALDLDALAAGTKTPLLDADGNPIVKPGKTKAGTLPAAWNNIGHTSRDDLPEFGYDGGDTEIRGTWQNESLREVETKPLADFITFKLHQFDVDTFELYFGKNASTTSGVFGVAGGNTRPVEKALLVIIIDGDERVGFHASKASIKRDDSISMKTDEFTALPVKATFLKNNADLKYSWINKDLFV